ncbi:cation-translocating P-type ATPase [Actinophytocola sp. NPDC049390]|uniref:cation-translocating P-type ATPase n=1 Tax=Actinophytocola sp. NPDC049390 TaxID=3363894 RepID=UPI00378ADCA0
MLGTDTQALTTPYCLPAADVLARLDVASDTGLTAQEVERRVRRYGPNVVPVQRGAGVLRMLAAQFHNPLIYVLLAAGVITLAFGDLVEAGVIAGVVVLNAVIGFVQESRARQALEALARMVPAETVVVRDGVTSRVPASALVPGDVVVLTAGDRVPADLRLIEVRTFEVDESVLTGESVPVVKAAGVLPADTGVADRVNMAHAGTVVSRGSARAVVVATGTGTELGAIQRMVADTAPVATPLTRKLAVFARRLSVVIVGVAVVTFVVALLRGMPVADAFTAVVALAVGAIPEGLPAAVSIVLAIGVVRMARRKAVVRHLPAVETLGGTTVICTDKTGTLTQNRMTVTTVWPADGAGRMECLVAGVLCNDATLRRGDDGWTADGDPTETALVTAAVSAGLDPGELHERFPRTDVLPFDPARRLMATTHRTPNGGCVGYLKGAVEEILARCADVDAEAVLARQAELAARGLRVLAFARFHPSGAVASQVDSPHATFIGLQAMHDPPREQAVCAVAACRAAGITVKMITGDHADTARAIAEATGLVDSTADATVVTGAELAGLDRLDDAADADVFARVSPEQKLDLVRVLQARGHVVAMTGDGVNDAPALRRADIGIAMGAGGTDAARGAADMVLLDDDFATIEAAVEEGRGVFDNLRRFIAWTVPTNIGEGMVILAAVLFGATLPIVPVQILWINMTTAVFLGLTMAFEPKAAGIMTRAPRPPERPLLTRTLVRQIMLVSAVLVVAAFLAFHWEISAGGTVEQARTTAVNVFVCVQIAYLFSCRALDRTLFGARLGRNRLLWVGIGVTLVLQLAITYVPVMNTLFGTAPTGPLAWLWAVAAAAVAFVVVEADKLLWRRRSTVH